MRRFLLGSIGLVALGWGALRVLAWGFAPAAPTEAPRATASAATATPTPTTGATNLYRASYAGFVGHELDLCTDYEGTAPLDKLQAALKANADLVPLAKSCSEQFPDRTVLATCALANTNPVGTLKTALHHYDADTVGDADAESCLKAHGDWQPNTDKWAVQHERTKRQLQQLQKLAAEPAQ